MLKFTGRETLYKNVDVILKQGGEGMVARKEDSKYVTARSPNFLKVKVSLLS